MGNGRYAEARRAHEGPAAVDRLLGAARSRFRRLSPAASQEAVQAGGLIVDIRSEWQRERHGRVPGAHFVPRNVLEWRADPTCPHHDPVLTGVEGLLVLMCAEGYQSSLAAAVLIDLGVADVADIAGGFDRWRTEGLPIVGAPRQCVTSRNGAGIEPTGRE